MIKEKKKTPQKGNAVFALKCPKVKPSWQVFIAVPQPSMRSGVYNGNAEAPP